MGDRLSGRPVLAPAAGVPAASAAAGGGTTATVEATRCPAMHAAAQVRADSAPVRGIVGNCCDAALHVGLSCPASLFTLRSHAACSRSESPTKPRETRRACRR